MREPLNRLVGCFFLAFFGYCVPYNATHGHPVLLFIDVFGIAAWTFVFVVAPYRGLVR